MKQVSNPMMTPEKIKEVIKSSLKAGDRIHITKKSRKPINNCPAIFKSAYNHFIIIETRVNDNYKETNTISYSELYTGEIVIHELFDKLSSVESGS
ncbi:MAG TPA: hypothetical protein GXZ48_00185 [Acholeplasmataceae bacterium]|jgi:uncharacterized protein Veg|nr:hypothetical protein [Acholeplasmataceae bacterium]